VALQIHGQHTKFGILELSSHPTTNQTFVCLTSTLHTTNPKEQFKNRYLPSKLFKESAQQQLMGWK